MLHIYIVTLNKYSRTLRKLKPPKISSKYKKLKIINLILSVHTLRLLSLHFKVYNTTRGMADVSFASLASKTSLMLSRK